MRSLLAWFVHNRVASNLLMWSLIIGGLLALPQLHREEFPNIEEDIISIVVPYPGASPAEVELSVCTRVEESIGSTPGIKKMVSVSAENSCRVTVEVDDGKDKNELLNEIKGKVDAINTFPAEAEQPVVSAVTILTNVVQLFIYGDTDEASLKRLAEKMRLDLIDLPEISQVFVDYAKPYEISIEVSEQTLRKYRTNLDQIARTIAANSIDLPAGSIDATDGQVLLRTVTQARDARAFEDIIIFSRDDGSDIRLGDIATIRDGFARSDVQARFNGQPALMVTVKRTGHEDVIVVADSVKRYVEQLERELPEGIDITLWTDESQDLIDRLDALGKNGVGGLLLVLVVLTLFLKPRLAFWVAVGLPISLMGMLMTFPFIGVTISTVSVVGTLLVLGILVDAGVVVSERVHSKVELGETAVQGAISGVHDVATPVIFGVLTSIVAFMPLVLMESSLGPFFSSIGVTAIVALVFSLVTSQLILPMQLSKMQVETHPPASRSRLSQLQDRLTSALARYARERYEPALHWCLDRRYLIMSIALAILIVMFGVFASGRLVISFFPSVAGERVFANLEMPVGTAADKTSEVTDLLLASAQQLRDELAREDSPVSVTDSMVSIGIQIGRGSLASNNESGGHQAEVAVQLDVPPDYNGPGAKEMAARWRELSGQVPGVEKLTFTGIAFSPGAAIEIELKGRNLDDLELAAAELRQALQSYPGVHDVVDSFSGGKRELQLALHPNARTLGIDNADLATQVRHAFYGAEVQRLPRGREDLKVMVRYPESERRSLDNIENMRIRTASGDEIPFVAVAEASLGRGMADIKRVNGQRVITVQADVNRRVIAPEEILADLGQGLLPELRQRHGISTSLGGEAEEAATALGSLFVAAGIAMFAIYTLLAIPLHSYLQPLIVMSVIPFGATGAVAGHVLLGEDLLFFSLLGMMALSGVAVNASLIMVDFYNREFTRLGDHRKALVSAGISRFRPLILTSATTFVGLIPLLVNESVSTLMFTPIAIALAFGVVTSAVIALFLVPCFCLILEEFKAESSRRLKLFRTGGLDNSRS